MESKKRFSLPFDLKKPTREYLNLNFIHDYENKYSPKILQFHYDPATYIQTGGPRIRMDVSAFFGIEVGIQYLFPYMDPEVLDFAVSIPRRLYHDGKTDRLIYRKAFQHMMPDSLYQVNYKHMASIVDLSQKGKTPDNLPNMSEFLQPIKEAKNMLLGHLDREFWNSYLNFDKIERIGEDTNISYEEYNHLLTVLNDLTYSAYIQNVGRNIKEYTRDI